MQGLSWKIKVDCAEAANSIIKFNRAGQSLLTNLKFIQTYRQAMMSIRNKSILNLIITIAINKALVIIVLTATIIANKKRVI